MPAAPAKGSAWAPLRNRAFRALFMAQIASNIGTMMHNVGATWLMGDLDSSPTLVALVQTATMLPVFLVGLPAGALADIVDRRILLIITQLSMLVTAAALAMLSFADHITETSLLLLTFALGLGAAFNMPAWQAIQPELVTRAELPQALALGNTTFNVGRAIGPAIGGLVVARGGPGWVFLLNAGSFLAIVAVLVRWRHRPEPTNAPVETIVGAMRAGLRYGVNSNALRHVLIRAALFVVPGTALVSLLPVVARGPLELGSGGFGLLLACFGLGAASSAIVRPRLILWLPVDRMMLVATVVVAGGLLVTGLSGNALLIGFTLLFTGAAWTLAITATGIAAQTSLPSWVRARGMGLWNLAVTGGVAVGSALWGAVASWRLGGAHVIAAASLVGLAAVTMRWKLSTPERLDMELVVMDEPVVTVTPAPTDGPVLVTVRYQVPDETYAEFVQAMRRVERQRRRTGAYRWGLFRDLADPGIVLETYVVQSWAEYMRQHRRFTNTDIAVLGEARRHVIGDPAMSHYISCYTEDGEPLPNVPPTSAS
ncbi:MAG: MFS transporter [Acidimicrobiia bacterium]